VSYRVHTAKVPGVATNLVAGLIDLCLPRLPGPLVGLIAATVAMACVGAQHFGGR